MRCHTAPTPLTKSIYPFDEDFFRCCNMSYSSRLWNSFTVTDIPTNQSVDASTCILSFPKPQIMNSIAIDISSPPAPLQPLIWTISTQTLMYIKGLCCFVQMYHNFLLVIHYPSPLSNPSSSSSLQSCDCCEPDILEQSP